MLMQRERELIAEYGRKLSNAGLCPGTSGNLSIYDPTLGLMAISPSGIDYFETEAGDVVVTDLEANIVEGSRRPSSEWALHTEFYKKKEDCRAVIHTHSVYCTTFSVLREPLKAVHFIIGDANCGEVPCAPYETFGTEALAAAAVESCGEANAVLLANHGIVVCAGNIKSAYSLALNMEYLAELQYLARCIGEPQCLDSGQMAAVMERFKSYGQKKSQM